MTIRTIVMAVALASLAISSAYPYAGTEDVSRKYEFVFPGRSSFGGCTFIALHPRIFHVSAHCLYKGGKKAERVSIITRDKHGRFAKLIDASHWDVPGRFKDTAPAVEKIIADTKKGAYAKGVSDARALSRMITENAAFDMGIVVFAEDVAKETVATILEAPGVSAAKLPIRVESTDDYLLPMSRWLGAFLHVDPSAQITFVGFGPKTCEKDKATGLVLKCTRDKHPTRRYGEVRLHRTIRWLGQHAPVVLHRFETLERDGVNSAALPGDSGGALLYERPGHPPILFALCRGKIWDADIATSLLFNWEFIERHLAVAKGQ